MNPAALTRLFDPRGAFADPFVGCFVVGILTLLGIAYAATFALHAAGRTSGAQHQELVLRLHSWAVMIPVLLVPVLLGAFWIILGLFVLSLFCYREFARLTGQFRNFRVSLWTVGAMALVYFAVLDKWSGLFAASQVLGMVLIAAGGLFIDQPKGYLQRVALGVVSFLFFGVSFGHVAGLGNDPDYRSLLLFFFLAVELNDVFGYVFGNLFGKRKLCPNTSPGKTWAGSIGAVAATSLLVVALGPFVFPGPLASPFSLLTLGLMLSVSGQLGDLVMSSVKRDIGVKDTGHVIPGHGGLLDRFDSLLLAGPAYYHYVNYFHGIGGSEPERWLTGLGVMP
jgi:phosphatidate cytidylyltransferase